MGIASLRKIASDIELFVLHAQFVLRSSIYILPWTKHPSPPWTEGPSSPEPLPSALAIKESVSQKIFWVLFWHVWIGLGLYKDFWRFLIFLLSLQF